MTKFEHEQALLMRYRLTSVWLTGLFLLGIGVRELVARHPELGVVPVGVACIGLTMLIFSYIVVRVLRDEAIARRDRSQVVLDSHESLNSTLFGYGHVRLVRPDDPA